MDIFHIFRFSRIRQQCVSQTNIQFESEESATFSANATYNNKYCSQTFMDEVMNLKFWKERKKFTSEEVEEKIFE